MPLGEKERHSLLGERRAERIGVAARTTVENGISNRRRRPEGGGGSPRSRSGLRGRVEDRQDFANS